MYLMVRIQVALHNKARMGKGKDRHHYRVSAETCEKQEREKEQENGREKSKRGCITHS
jgi:hypothetical protein